MKELISMSRKSRKPARNGSDSDIKDYLMIFGIIALTSFGIFFIVSFFIPMKNYWEVRSFDSAGVASGESDAFLEDIMSLDYAYDLPPEYNASTDELKRVYFSSVSNSVLSILDIHKDYDRKWAGWEGSGLEKRNMKLDTYIVLNTAQVKAIYDTYDLPSWKTGDDFHVLLFKNVTINAPVIISTYVRNITTDQVTYEYLDFRLATEYTSRIALIREGEHVYLCPYDMVKLNINTVGELDNIYYIRENRVTMTVITRYEDGEFSFFNYVFGRQFLFRRLPTL